MMKKLNISEEELLEQIINIAKISSTPGNELLKARYVQKQFFYNGIKENYIDPAGNVVVKIKNTNKKTIIISTNLDNIEDNDKFRITFDKISGKNIENGLSIYTMIIISNLIKNKETKNNLTFLATTESNTTFNGIKYFIDNNDSEIAGVINLSGIGQGKISISGDFFLGVKILFSSDKKNKTIFAINNFINKLRYQDIHNYLISEAELKFDKGYIKLEFKGSNIIEIEELKSTLKNISDEIYKDENVDITTIEEFMKQGFSDSDSLLQEVFVDSAKKLNISISKEKKNTQIAYPISKGIKSINVGIAKGNINEKEEYLEIKSISKGIEYIIESILEFDRRCE